MLGCVKPTSDEVLDCIQQVSVKDIIMALEVLFEALKLNLYYLP